MYIYIHIYMYRENAAHFYTLILTVLALLPSILVLKKPFFYIGKCMGVGGKG